VPSRVSTRGPRAVAPPPTRARLQPPNPPPLLLDRPRLLDALVANADRTLTLLVADAGYGKSTLLAAAGRALRRPVLWYSLTAVDGDPVVFSRHLLEAFRRDTPRFGRDLERLLGEIRPGPRVAEHLGGLLSNAMVALSGPPRHLVLDDFHELPAGSPVPGMIDALLQHPPARVRFWIAGRSEPPLALARLRARGGLFEVDSGALAFDRDELDRLFRETFARPLDAAEVAALEEATRGWPTAVHLVREALVRRPGTTLGEVLASLDDSALDLTGYLSSEVYGRLDDGDRLLLERTALLARFDGELARTMSGLDDARKRLATLAQRGLVRSFGAGAQVSYAASELVRRFVRGRLESTLGPSGLAALAADTARALEARGDLERALRHALDAGAADHAGALLLALAPVLLGQGRAAALLAFLAELPPEALVAEPGLRLARADAQQAVGLWNEAAADYEAILSSARSTHRRDDEVRALIGLGKVLNLRGRHEQVLGMAEHGLAIVGEEAIEARARLLQMKAAAHFYLGHSQAAIALLDEVRDLLKGGGDPELLVPTIHNLAIAYAARGHFDLASREFRSALAHVRGTASPRAALYLSNLATLLLETGEVAEARAAAEEALVAAQRFSNRMHETMAQESLAEVLAHAGDLDGAVTALHRAEELNAEMRMDVLTADLLALRGRIFCARGQYLRAVGFMTRALEHLAERPDAPRLVAFRAQLAWCELRAGRPHVARDHLEACLVPAEAGENDDHRMRVHYWLAEALLALDGTGAGVADGGSSARARAGAKAGAKAGPKGAGATIDGHLATALALVRENGYEHFLRLQAREEPAPLLRALARGIEVDACATALVEAGPRVETALLALLDSADTGVGEATLSILGEIGGAAACERLRSVGQARRGLAPAAATALRHIEERLVRSGAGAAIGGRAGRGPSAGRAGTGDATAPAVRLHLFGPPQVTLGGRPLPASAWRTQRAFHMLILLALKPRGVTRDELLETFWPGRRAAAGRRNFHPTLSYLRSVLPRSDEPLLLRDSELYRLNPGYDLSCDLWEFDAAFDEARRAGQEAKKRDALARAAGLAERAPLEGIYDPWAEEAQGRLRDRIETVFIQHGEALAHDGHDEAALACFRRAAGIDEYRESTRVAIVECLVRLGTRGAAVVEWERLRELLRRELGVEPLPETAAAIEKALGLAAAGSAAEGRKTPEPIAALADAAIAQVALKTSRRGSAP
jgi:LuxR family maltose regulon positive regulatory protein